MHFFVIFLIDLFYWEFADVPFNAGYLYINLLRESIMVSDLRSFKNFISLILVAPWSVLKRDRKVKYFSALKTASKKIKT